MATDGGISLGELAEQRSISKDAAWRLVKAGKVPAPQAAGTHGPAWCCHPDGEIPERDGSAGPAPGLHNGPATVAQPEAVAALVDRLTVENVTVENGELVKAVAAWQSQAVVLAGRLADARDPLALTAPPESVPAGQETPRPVGADAVTRWRLSSRWRALVPWMVTALAIVAVIVLLVVPR